MPRETPREARERRARGVLKLKFKQQESLELVLAGRSSEVPYHRLYRLRDQGLVTYVGRGQEPTLTERGRRSLEEAQATKERVFDAP